MPKQQRVIEAVDGSYEQEYTCYPPAVTMVVFSLIMVSLMYSYFERITLSVQFKIDSFRIDFHLHIRQSASV